MALRERMTDGTPPHEETAEDEALALHERIKSAAALTTTPASRPTVKQAVPKPARASDPYAVLKASVHRAVIAVARTAAEALA